MQDPRIRGATLLHWQPFQLQQDRICADILKKEPRAIVPKLTSVIMLFHWLGSNNIRYSALWIILAEPASTRMEDRELRLAAGRFTQLAVAQMNTDFCLNMPTHHNAHERSRYSEHRRMADPVDPYLGQQCEPAESKLSEPVDPYSFGKRTVYMLDADLDKKI